jgi:hypothetical protein
MLPPARYSTTMTVTRVVALAFALVMIAPAAEAAGAGDPLI